MVLHLAEQFETPLRERNVLLVVAGYAPVFPKRLLVDPALSAARKAIDLVLAGHEPYPALAIDRHWTLVASNDAVTRLLAGADPSLLQPPVNVLRLSLHPKGIAPRIANLTEWRAHLLVRLRRQIEVTPDSVLAKLIRELRDYLTADKAESSKPVTDGEYADVVVPFQLVAEGGILSFLGTTTIFGTPVDITLSELAIESFFPAVVATVQTLRLFAEGQG